MTRRKKIVIASLSIVLLLAIFAMPAMATILWNNYTAPYVRAENVGNDGDLIVRGQDTSPTFNLQGTPVINETCWASGYHTCRCWLMEVGGGGSTRVWCFLTMMTPTSAPTQDPYGG